MTKTRALSFRDVDGLAFAASANHLDAGLAPVSLAPQTLGPLLEFLHLQSGQRLPKHPEGKSWLVSNGATPLIAALQRGDEQWNSPSDRRMGFIRARRTDSNGNSLISFLMNASTAARDIAGLPGTVPRQLAAAMQELENNIHEHSDAIDTGLLAYRAGPGVFEFVAADRGIGILKSLQSCTAYAGLPDHGKALQAALTDGTSRFGPETDRGHGFRPIFLGLANLRGALRFRSGDHALIMDGTSPDLTTAQLSQKPLIDGFFASVSCHANARSAGDERNQIDAA
jgi:hypothetical protein